MYKLHKMRIVVIGAGIIGVTSAVELSKLGHEVTLVDQLEDVCLGTSAENTGHLISSHGAATCTLTFYQLVHCSHINAMSETFRAVRRVYHCLS